MRIKRFSALFLAILLASFTLTAYAATFTDVSDDYWAKDYIEEMAEIGLIKGYPDGTFMPSNAVSKWECLILAARVLGFNNEENKEFIQLASENYMSSLHSYNVSNKEEIAYLMYWGVLKSSDLSAYLSEQNKNTPQLRHEAATLLTKVMGGEQEALDQMLVESDYSDASLIPASAKPFVAYATEKKLMQGTGENKFDPLLQVSRAQMATMMFNTMRAMNHTVLDVTIQQTTASNKSINIIKEDGTTAKYTLSNNTLIRLDGKSSEFDALLQGMSVSIYLQEGKVRMVEGLTEVSTLVAEGRIVIAGTQTGSDYITIAEEDENGNETNNKYTIASNAAITLSGTKALFSQIKADQYATIYYTGNRIAYKVEAEGKTTSVNGTLLELIMDPPSLLLKLNNGEEKTFLLLNDTGITRNDLSAVIRDLAVGDRLDMTLEHKKVKSIRATSISNTTEGIIKEIVFADTITIAVKVGNDTVTYNVTPNTQVYIDNQLSNVYALRVNANAKIYLESNNISRIDSNAVVGPTQVTGIVKSVNVNYGILTLEEVGGGERQVAIKKNCVIVDNTGTNISIFSKITTGRMVVCFGVMNSGVYEVNTIIITN